MMQLRRERITALLERARSVRALVVGDLMLDVYLRGTVSRVSPEAPVPVVRVLEETVALGGGANVAVNIAALGARCTVVGCAGRDAAGEALLRELDALGIEREGVLVDGSRPTTVKTRVMARQHQVARYDREVDDDVDGACALALVAAIERLAPSVDVIVLEDYNKGVLVPAVIEAAMDAGRLLGKPVVVDPKERHFFDYRGATVFKPNLVELAGALRAPILADDREWMERTRRHVDCSHLLVTLGEEGMALMTEEGEFVRVPTVARSVYDVSGAGDTVTATVAVMLAAGASPVEAAVVANYAAGIEVGKAGVAAVSAAELVESIGGA